MLPRLGVRLRAWHQHPLDASFSNVGDALQFLNGLIALQHLWQSPNEILTSLIQVRKPSAATKPMKNSSRSRIRAAAEGCSKNLDSNPSYFSPQATKSLPTARFQNSIQLIHGYNHVCFNAFSCTPSWIIQPVAEQANYP